MKNRIGLQLCLAGLIPLVMTGCSDNDNKPVVVIEDPDEFEQLSSQSSNRDPLSIDDAALQSAITALFGPANGEPIALQAGETIEAIIKRAGGS